VFVTHKYRFNRMQVFTLQGDGISAVSRLLAKTINGYRRSNVQLVFAARQEQQSSQGGQTKKVYYIVFHDSFRFN
jgi:hypothetical protein